MDKNRWNSSKKKQTNKQRRRLDLCSDGESNEEQWITVFVPLDGVFEIGSRNRFAFDARRVQRRLVADIRNVGP